MNQVQNIADALGRLSGELAQMRPEESAGGLESVLQQLNRLNAEFQQASAQTPPDAPESARQELVRCRTALREMMGMVSGIRSGIAEQYRQALGERKEAFEQLEPGLQENSEPDAYRYLQLFRGMDEVSRQVHQLDNAMLDAGYALGRGRQARQADDATAYGDTGMDPILSETGIADAGVPDSFQG